MPIPQTAGEARAQGYEVRKLTAAQAKEIMSAHDAVAGIHPFERPKDCSTIPTNGICWEGNCILGEKEVLYCDRTQGCTLYAKVRC
ncbi:hypothetical protein [Rhodopseudomonas parapalustris]